MPRRSERSWEAALEEFLEPWLGSEEVEGVVATGSRVFGTATPRSDVDVHIVLADGTDWRERGNRVVRGFLIEYFANPVAQIQKYMEEDHLEGKRTDARMLALGRIVFDRRGAVNDLRSDAKRRFEEPFPEMGRDEVELAKYGLWDQLDGLHDLWEARSPGFRYTADLALAHLVEVLARFHQVEAPPPTRLHPFLTDARFRERYGLPELPAPDLVEGLRSALEDEDGEHLLGTIARLTSQVLDAMGGFDIDGWRLRSVPTV
jgi:hypothetical protein